MPYHVRCAKEEDLAKILEIYCCARCFMKENGNPDQWGSTYPPQELLLQDLAAKKLFVMTDDQRICGVFYFEIGEDPTYLTIYHGSWRSEKPYGTIHRIAGDGSGGIVRTAVDFAKNQIDHLRIDTHKDNIVMQRAVEKQGFVYRGIICLEDGSERLAYDLLT